MTIPRIGRRTFMTSTAAAAAVSSTAGAARAADDGEDFVYEIARSDEEWRDRLSSEEYFVLRERGTETPRSSPLWNSKDVGTYCCKGCELTIYDSLQKIQLEKGWAFFRHSRPATVMTALDLAGGAMSDPFARLGAMMEAHCRRCGSHLGHIVALPEVPNRPIHCINGHALNFQPQTA